MLAMRRRINPCGSNSKFSLPSAVPLAAVVAPLVGETHGDAVVAKRPQLLDQPIVELALPRARAIVWLTTLV